MQLSWLPWKRRSRKRPRKREVDDLEQLGFDPADYSGIAQIRVATERDLEALRPRLRDAFEINFPRSDWKAVGRTYCLAFRKAVTGYPDGPDTVLVAAAADSTVLGFVWWRLHRGGDGTPEAVIEGIGVDPAHRNKGVGRVISEAALQWIVRDQRANRITAAVSTANDPVRRLLVTFGFDQRFAVWSRDIER